MIYRLLNVSIGTACLALGALLLVVSGGMGTALAQSNSLPEKGSYSEVKGKVVDDLTGASLGGAVVSLLYESVTTAADGTFTFGKIPTIHGSDITLRLATDEGLVTTCTTFNTPVSFYPISVTIGNKVDIQIIEPSKNSEILLRPKTVEIKDAGAYCADCHIKNPCMESSSFSIKVKSGNDLRGIIVKESQLENFKKELLEKGIDKNTYKKIRYKDTHPYDIDLNSRVTDEGDLAGMHKHPTDLRLLDIAGEPPKSMIVCDTCHTRHVQTPQRQYVVLPFEEESELCYQCHK
jgi:predicted CXXCH cytochrome family protein